MHKPSGPVRSAVRRGRRSGTWCAPQCARRRAFSLIEVLLATVIFVGSVTAVTHMVQLGLWGADMSRARAIGALLAESKLAEIEAGLSDAASEGSGEFEEHPGFKWEVSRQAGAVTGVQAITVKIVYETHDDSFELSVTRWMASQAEGF